jgi:hypothetical protein
VAAAARTAAALGRQPFGTLRAGRGATLAVTVPAGTSFMAPHAPASDVPERRRAKSVVYQASGATDRHAAKPRRDRLTAVARATVP